MIYPPNLSFDKRTGFYRYRDVTTGQFHQMNRKKAESVAAAKQLNSHLMTGQDLVAKVLGQGQTIQTFIDTTFELALMQKELAAHTLTVYRQQLQVIRECLGKRLVSEVTVGQIAEFLKPFKSRPTTYNHYRGLLGQLFTHAIAEGMRSDNPLRAHSKPRYGRNVNV